VRAKQRERLVTVPSRVPATGTKSAITGTDSPLPGRRLKLRSKDMIRRLLILSALITFPLVLVACPGEDDDLGDEIEEAADEIEDEIDDAL
jgi:hypothetical protein